MKTRTRLPAANGIAPELLPSSFLLYSFVPLFPFKRSFQRKGEASKASHGSEGKESCNRSRLRTGVGKNLAKGTTFLIPLQAQGIRFSFTLGETENSISGEALVVAGGGGKAFSGPVNGES
ncbi:hypothetical protein Salat_2998100 [Sesamum alatum]|uniref:Uncharacterized protein n=1 Tax=Sesamum alatum TaxID=300844 RepID=A0AAE1XHH8_9LAMI|nr:hypothetical protein Salat_2998100 [Sesamum alatum]